MLNEWEDLRQMVYGDGGHSNYYFTARLDVIVHGMTVCVSSTSKFLWTLQLMIGISACSYRIYLQLEIRR